MCVFILSSVFIYSHSSHTPQQQKSWSGGSGGLKAHKLVLGTTSTFSSLTVQWLYWYSPSWWRLWNPDDAAVICYTRKIAFSCNSGALQAKFLFFRRKNFLLEKNFWHEKKNSGIRKILKHFFWRKLISGGKLFLAETKCWRKKDFCQNLFVEKKNW